MFLIGLIVTVSIFASTPSVMAQSCGGGTLTGAQPILNCPGGCNPNVIPSCCTPSCNGVTLAIEYCSDYTNEASCNDAGFGGSFTCGTGGSCSWGGTGGGGGGSSCPGECRQGSSCGAGYSGASGCSGSGPGGGCKSNQVCCSANSCGGGGGGGTVQCVPPADCPPGTVKSAVVSSAVCQPICGNNAWGTGGSPGSAQSYGECCKMEETGGGNCVWEPCHMDDGIFVLRISQFLHQREHAVKVELCLGKFGGMFQAIIHERVEIIEGFVVLGFDVHARDCKWQTCTEQG